MRLAFPAIPALPCHEVASAPLFKPMRRHASASSLSPAVLPRSKTRATGGSLSGSGYHPHSAAAGRGPRSQATPLPVIAKPFRGDSPILRKCDTIISTSPQPWSKLLRRYSITYLCPAHTVLVWKGGGLGLPHLAHFAQRRGLLALSPRSCTTRRHF